MIFNNLPKSSIYNVSDDYEPGVLKKVQKKAKDFESNRVKEVLEAYERVKSKEDQTQLEQNLVKLYEEAKLENGQ